MPPIFSIATARIAGLLQEIQRALLDDAASFAEAHTFRAATYDELRALLVDPGGFVVGAWCGSGECEADVKAATKATIRYLPLEPVVPEQPCVVCGRSAADEATWAIAY